MQQDASPNHEFILELIPSLSQPGARILDLGCGAGHFVRSARQRGLDAWGCDTYAGRWTDWRDTIGPDLSQFIAENSDRQIPYPASHFDLVVTNQVLEHVPFSSLPDLLSEVRRILKPGATFLALFPIRETWFEGHVGLYFPHRLQSWPAVERTFLASSYRLGFGYHRNAEGPAAWTSKAQKILREDVYFHSRQDLLDLWIRTFGAPPSSSALDYMIYRIRPHPRAQSWTKLATSALVAPLLRFVCEKRAGVVWVVRRAVV